MVRSRPSVAVAVAVLVLLCAAPAGAQEPSDEDLAVRAYSGLGTWVDLYNERPWAHPEEVVAEMAAHGVETIYLETSSYKFGKAIVHPRAVGTYIDSAHEHGMTVVAWYLPSFKPLRRDYRRSLAAIGFASPSGQTFDSFALDIEATVVADVEKRNERTTRLAGALREAVGEDYPLAAIVPDPVGSLYWTDFPYPDLAEVFDAFLPMSYFTYRVDGAREVRRYIRANVRAVRDRTGWPDAPVHPIGGIADVARLAEVRAYVRAVFDEQALGGSLYDFPLTTTEQWNALQSLKTTRVVPPEAVPPPIGHRHLL